MKKYRKTLILSGIITLLPIVIGLLLWDKLPDTMTTHWGPDGNPDAWMGKLTAIVVMPAVLLPVQWLCFWITLKDPGNRGKNEKALKLALWIIPVLSLGCSCAMYAITLGVEFGIHLLLNVTMGLMFVVLGNYMPKCGQNSTIGIKLRWTLSNRENWNKTHALAGKTWMAGGAAILLASFLPANLSVAFCFSTMVLIVLIPVAYSWSIYRAHKAEGVEYVWQNPYPKWMGRFSGVAVALILAFCAALLFSGNVEVEVGETAFTVDSVYYQALTVDYTTVDSMELQESCPAGDRIGGFGSPRLLLGNFRNEAFGNYVRYSYNRNGPAIVIRSGEKVLVIGLQEAEDTRRLYEAITSHIS